MQGILLSERTWFIPHQSKFDVKPGFFRCFRDTNRVPRIENRVPGIGENYHRVSKIKENRIPRISEIVSLQDHTGYLTFFLEKPCLKPTWGHIKALSVKNFTVMPDESYTVLAILLHFLCSGNLKILYESGKVAYDATLVLITS